MSAFFFFAGFFLVFRIGKPEAPCFVPPSISVGVPSTAVDSALRLLSWVKSLDACWAVRSSVFTAPSSSLSWSTIRGSSFVLYFVWRIVDWAGSKNNLNKKVFVLRENYVALSKSPLCRCRRTGVVSLRSL